MLAILMLMLVNSIDMSISVMLRSTQEARWGNTSVSPKDYIGISPSIAFPSALSPDGSIVFGLRGDILKVQNRVVVDSTFSFNMDGLTFGLSPYINITFTTPLIDKTPKSGLTLSGFLGYTLYDVKTPWSQVKYDYKEPAIGVSVYYTHVISTELPFSPWLVKLGWFYRKNNLIEENGFSFGAEIYLHYETKLSPLRYSVVTNSKGYFKNSHSIYDYNKRISNFNKVGDTLEVKYLNGKSYKWPVNKIALLVIGVEKYFQIKNLRYCVEDGKEVADTFRSYPGYNRIVVKELYDTNVTTRSVIDAIDELNSYIDSTYLFVLYFSGHGALSGNEFYFGTYNIDITLSNALKASELFYKLFSTKARNFLILLDACHSGGSEYAMSNIWNETWDRTMWNKTFEHVVTSTEEKATESVLLEGPGHFSGHVYNVTIISASAPNETAKEYPSLKHGVFTYTLLKCLGEMKNNLLDGNDINNNSLSECLFRAMPETIKGNKGFSDPGVSNKPWDFVSGRQIILFRGRQSK